MSSATRWRSLWRWIGARMYPVRKIHETLTRTGDRYIDVDGWSEITGVSEAEARKHLALGVNLGHFDRYLLYEWNDAPIPFVVPERYLHRTVQMHEVGYLGEDNEKEIYISPLRVREVYVARNSAGH